MSHKKWDTTPQLNMKLTKNNILNKFRDYSNVSENIKYTGKVMIAVNHEYVEKNYLLNHEDEIAFFPPVTGG